MAPKNDRFADRASTRLLAWEAEPHELLALLDKATEEITDYAIGFARFQENSEPVDAELAGSGTLVSIDGKDGILTAAHVIEHLPDKGGVGLILLAGRSQGQVHSFILSMQFVQKIVIAKGSTDCEGPDLGFLVLPPDKVGTIKARKSFYNIAKRRDRVLSEIPAIDNGFWCLCGCAHEWTDDAAPEHDFKRVKNFRGLCGAGIVKEEYQKDGYDFLEFEANYDDAYEGPQSFEGFSGGGLWQILIEKPENGDLQVKECILSGVAFWQSDIADDLRTIKCHGRRSIYEIVVYAVA